MRVIGLDIATTTGFSIMDNDRLIAAGSFCCRSDSDGEFFGKFRKELHTILARYDPRHAAIEGYLPTNKKQKRVRRDMYGDYFSVEADATSGAVQSRLLGLQGIAKGLLWEMGVLYFTPTSSQWRKSFLGVGKAPGHLSSYQRRKWWKQQSLERCRLLRYDVRQEDACEATGIAFWLTGTLKLRKFEDGDLFAENAA